MKPFNLEEALKGKPVVTRDGRKDVLVHRFPGAKHLVALINGKHYIMGLGGSYFSTETASIVDLFMEEEERTYYMNVFKSGQAYVYPDAKTAKGIVNEADKYLVIAYPVTVKV